jgi:predicted HTH transcriptional regulator
MQILIYIIILIVGIAIGRKLNSTSSGSSFETSKKMSELSKEAKIAINKRKDKRKTRIMELANKQEKITNDNVEDMFCISDSTARTYLNELEHEGKLNQVGVTGRGVYYVPILK